MNKRQQFTNDTKLLVTLTLYCEQYPEHTDLCGISQTVYRSVVFPQERQQTQGFHPDQNHTEQPAYKHKTPLLRLHPKMVTFASSSNTNMADSPLFEWKNNKVLIQSKNSKGNKTLMEKTDIFNINTSSSYVSVALCDCDHLSIIGYGTKKLQLEVKSSWINTKQPPQTAGQVLKSTNTQSQISEILENIENNDLSKCFMVLTSLCMCIYVFGSVCLSYTVCKVDIQLAC